MIKEHPSTMVVYYSNTGNNRFLAEKIAQSLNTEAVEIVPVLRGQVLLMALSFLNIGLTPKSFNFNLADYDQVVLCGPIWSGTLVSPLRGFLGKYRKSIKSLIFVTCCGSIDEQKDSRFGYNRIFDKVKKLMGSKVSHCEAFPIALTVPEEKRKDEKTILEMKLTDDNFTGVIKDRYDRFIGRFKKNKAGSSGLHLISPKKEGVSHG